MRNSSFASSPNIPNGDWNLAGNRGMVNIPDWIERCQVTETNLAPSSTSTLANQTVDHSVFCTDGKCNHSRFLSYSPLYFKAPLRSFANRYISRLPDRHVNGPDTHPLTPNGDKSRGTTYPRFAKHRSPSHWSPSSAWPSTEDFR